MKNPYLKPQSHRANVLTALFALLVIKIAVAGLILFSITDINALAQPRNTIVMGWLVLAFVFDMFTVYHLTTRWHRLDRHSWVVLPSPLLNLGWAIVLMTPAFYPLALSSLASILPDAPWVSLATLGSLAIIIVIGLLELIASLRLMHRLRPLPA